MKAAASLIGLAVVACSQTVALPIGLDGDDETCGDATSELEGGECARSVEVALREGSRTLESDCLALSGLDQLRDLTAVLANLSFDGVDEGSVIIVEVTVFDSANCEGNAIVTGSSPPTTLEGDDPRIDIELVCTGEGSCELQSLVADIETLLGGVPPNEELNVSAGFSSDSFTLEVNMTQQGDGRYTAEGSTEGDGCLSVAVENAFGDLALVSCGDSVGPSSEDNLFGFAVVDSELRQAFDEAGLAVSGTVVGRVQSEASNPRAGVRLDTGGTVFYYRTGTEEFVTAEGDAATDESGVFAITYGDVGCCQTVTVEGSADSATAHPLAGSVSGLRIIAGDGDKF